VRLGPHLSKSRYVAGLQCPKMLWWMVHEPGAPESVAGAGVQTLLDRGRVIGAAARAHVPGGVLIDLPPYRLQERVAATTDAMASRAPVIYEASFVAEGVFISVDILERRRKGFVLTEVKSSLDVKGEHIPDVAIQLHILRHAGVPVGRAEVMHLNRDCRYPDLSNLFIRKNVTRLAETAGRSVPRTVRSLLAMLRGPLPDVTTGPHCTEPYECPFIARCWPPRAKHHVSTLYRISAMKLDKLLKAGHETLLDLPPDYATTGPMRRQIDSVRKRRVVVERGLAEVLKQIKPPVAFLDFETVSPGIPAWSGCHPYDQVPVQFSCHVTGPRGLVHHEWLADGPGDPREPFARALLDACQGAGTVLAYHAPFERRCMESLGDVLPRLAGQLSRLRDRVEDLLPIVRDHVYHPRFLGSFSLKDVLPALVPGMGYDDLEIQDGGSASAALEALLLEAGAFTAAEQRALRRDLLRYCERDTLGIVRLYERLGELARGR
jgi:predicted RecB family nuclease